MEATDDDRISPVEILLIEPNPGDERLFAESIADARITNTVHTVSGGDAALDFVHRRGDYADAPRPDLVLLEPRLHDTSSAEVLSALKDDPELREVPIVILTSSAGGEEVVESQGLDADHYVRKPIEPENFLEFAREIEEFWLALVRTSDGA